MTRSSSSLLEIVLDTLTVQLYMMGSAWWRDVNTVISSGDSHLGWRRWGTLLLGFLGRGGVQILPETEAHVAVLALDDTRVRLYEPAPVTPWPGARLSTDEKITNLLWSPASLTSPAPPH